MKKPFDSEYCTSD